MGKNKPCCFKNVRRATTGHSEEKIFFFFSLSPERSLSFSKESHAVNQGQSNSVWKSGLTFLGFKHAVPEHSAFQIRASAIKPPTPGAQLVSTARVTFKLHRTLQSFRNPENVKKFFQFRLTKAISSSAEDPHQALGLLYPARRLGRIRPCQHQAPAPGPPDRSCSRMAEWGHPSPTGTKHSPRLQPWKKAQEGARTDKAVWAPAVLWAGWLVLKPGLCQAEPVCFRVK